MQIVINYLIERINKNSHGNRSVKLFQEHKEEVMPKLEALVMESLHIIVSHFKIGDDASCKLTALSMAIGNCIINRTNMPDSDENQLLVGDFILEAYFQNMIIDIRREKRGLGSPYIVNQGINWKEVRKLSDTQIDDMTKQFISKDPIELVNKLYQYEHNKPLIKHWKKSKSKEFEKYLDKPFIKTVNKLQRTAWKLNHEVLDAVKLYRDDLLCEHIEIFDSDNNPIQFSIYTDFEDLENSDYYWIRNGRKSVFKPHLAQWAQRREKDAYHKRRRLINKNKKAYRDKILQETEEYRKLEKEENDFGKIYSVFREAEKEIEALKSKADNYKFTIDQIDFVKRKLNDKPFYQYIDLDYRGRVYYMTPFLNYQSDDIARGILLFNEGKAITEEGLRHLCIHIANSFNQDYNIDDLAKLPYINNKYIPYLKKQGLESLSVDKFTLDDKVEWVQDNIAFICEVAEDLVIIPEAEKPVVFLSACIELNNHLKAKIEGKVYYSHLPIPIDGSNNGWQHLAAISKDDQAGELVGLVPTEIQKDFYVQTAKELYNLVPEGKLKDLLTEMPMKAIRKGISKRGSMTRAYSAGKFAIATNMYEDCRVEGYTEEYGITKSICNDLAHYLIEAINNVCPGPLTTMTFLQKIAIEGISDSVEDKENYLTWITPSGFPVKYDYWKKLKFKFKGYIKGVGKTGRIEHVYTKNSTIPLRKKYNSGISPNFIHSQDAAHMSLVAADWSHSFIGIHDSFSTHACDVKQLINITKDKFINMYNYENYFDKILELFQVDVTKPELGNLNVELVRDSDYFFA